MKAREKTQSTTHIPSEEFSSLRIDQVASYLKGCIRNHQGGSLTVDTFPDAHAGASEAAFNKLLGEYEFAQIIWMLIIKNDINIEKDMPSESFSAEFISRINQIKDDVHTTPIQKFKKQFESVIDGNWQSISKWLDSHDVKYTSEYIIESRLDQHIEGIGEVWRLQFVIEGEEVLKLYSTLGIERPKVMTSTSLLFNKDTPPDLQHSNFSDVQTAQNNRLK